ncbi:hypothetical protein [Undibacterium terreum]|uniref:hypothetical protein n=1 Tax=Undibacterium terreum TaxID=1224302 RepID=UPI0016675ABB|nr:hypothetical protein [Undibacterium terreum]
MHLKFLALQLGWVTASNNRHIHAKNSVGFLSINIQKIIFMVILSVLFILYSGASIASTSTVKGLWRTGGMMASDLSDPTASCTYFAEHTNPNQPYPICGMGPFGAQLRNQYACNGDSGYGCQTFAFTMLNCPIGSKLSLDGKSCECPSGTQYFDDAKKCIIVKKDDPKFGGKSNKARPHQKH